MKQILVVLVLGLGACVATPAGDPLPQSGFKDGWVLYPSLSSATGLGMLQPLTRGCPVTAQDRETLATLKAKDFEVPDDAFRQTFAKAVTLCLASPDPWLRDGIAYEALSHMLRGKQLTDETKRALLVDLTRRLGAPEGDGFERPFAALVLSEVARADRIDPYLTEDELVKLLVDAQAWFINISDYRGFDEVQGWRHGVAHGSDLLMQLALNPRIDKEGLGVIVSAVGVKVAPKGVSYIDGESERLARPVLFAASRGVVSEAQWSEWLKQLAAPPADLADKMFTSVNGLAWRHDTKAFLNALYAGVTLDTDKGNDVMRAGLEAALKAMS